MDRQGLATTTQGAATAGAAPNTVRYHLATAAEPSLRDDHRNATRPKGPTRVTPAGCKTSTKPSPCTRPKAGSPQPSPSLHGNVPSRRRYRKGALSKKANAAGTFYFVNWDAVWRCENT
jgi:hypothetical protein